MKKTLIIVLAGIMLFAFTQCDNGTKNGSAEEETSKGSEAFKMAQNVLSGWEMDIEMATTCDDMEEAMNSFERRSKHIKEDELSEEEMEELRYRVIEIAMNAMSKEEELCQEEGTEAYKSAKKLLSELESSLYTATTCNDLEEASNRFIDKASEIDDDSFTEEEKEKLEKQVEDLLAKVEAKSNELCNNDYVEDNPNGSNSNGSSVISTVNRLFNDYERALDNAKNCDDVEKAADDFEKAMKALDSKYPDYEISESEQKEIEELTERLISKAIEKTKQLCK